MSGKDNSRTRQAVRRAREARAAREEALAIREAQVEAALVEFFAAKGEVERIRQQATLKADAVLAEAARVAVAPWAAACAAVRRLRDLCGSNATVAELCGLKLQDVREMLAVPRAGEEPPPAGADEAADPGESTGDTGAPDDVAEEPGGGGGRAGVVRYGMP